MLRGMLGQRDLDDLGRLVLRVTIGGLLLLHGIHKLRHGVGGIADHLHDRGLPGFVAYGVYIGEVVAPAAMIAGVRARLAGLVVAFNMLVAILLVHPGDIASLSGSGAWRIELPALYLLGAIAVFLLGAGRFALSRDSRMD